ncbi:hypothetical protein LZ575_16525 [Antarcticibacterium sp. 1MA-6-2]|uniref:hypothetical protein n=1 Tax=Antarcticibacterium sp. 1MA-6-2 TaxID=2908210 RepID=UPI001F1E007D|nr:hypothetical protein [Antarcticibacterium sp. 1MA-6-2]UJH90420.1 hypothetical protein LZ575_16525 [Antarcticibacterium sp. 1MA-6-2]
MQEEKKDVHQAAEVILMIISYEGEIEDLIEYPSEFEDAYKELLSHKIIKLKDGKYIPDVNFKKASTKGYRKYLEDLENPPAYKKFLASKPAIGVVAGAILVASYYILQSNRRV